MKRTKEHLEMYLSEGAMSNYFRLECQSRQLEKFGGRPDRGTRRSLGVSYFDYCQSDFKLEVPTYNLNFF